jgi:iron complex transport system permease protein
MSVRLDQRSAAAAELRIGVVTAVIGGPFFLWILLRRRGLVDL